MAFNKKASVGSEGFASLKSPNEFEFLKLNDYGGVIFGLYNDNPKQSPQSDDFCSDAYHSTNIKINAWTLFLDVLSATVDVLIRKYKVLSSYISF